MGVPSVLAIALVGLLVGLSVLTLAARTRRGLETYVGLGLSALGGGYGLLVAGKQAVGDDPSLGVVLMAAGRLLLSLGGIVPALLAQRVYRVDDRKAFVAVLMIFAATTFFWMGDGAAMGFRYDLTDGTYNLPAQLLRAACLGWACVESFLLWGRLRARARVGLADPAQSNLFALLGLGFAATAATMILGIVSVLVEPDAGYDFVLEAAMTASGTVCAVSFVLAFFPPRFYRRWIAGRAPGSQDAGT